MKMCDFGNATTQRLSPDHTWSATQRGLTEDEVRERRERERGREREREREREGVREREGLIFHVLLSLLLMYRCSVSLLQCTGHPK